MRIAKVIVWTIVLPTVLLLCASLVSAQSKPLQPLWQRDNTDYKQYSKLLIKPLDVSDIKVQRPPWAKDDPIEWSLEMMNKEAIQAMFQSTMTRVLEANNGYAVVYESGDDVLEVNMTLLSIMPYVRPGSGGKDGDHQVITLGSGEVMASASLRDSQSRRLLLILEGERVIGQDYSEPSRENAIINLKGMFTTFAERLRSAMDEIHGQ